MANQHMRLRFAPSPTGPIHVGNAHTMLFNWLWCRNQGAQFILRFEDTDRERSLPEWEAVVISEMRWLGLDWDEGPDIGGPFAPYYQTQRMHLYQQYFELLKDRGAVYPCYCTSEELAQERRVADLQKVAYKYSRACLKLTAEERAAREAEGRHAGWRLLVPDNEIVAYEDMIRGRIEFDSRTIGDPLIMRSNGMPLYNFAVVIDDITMEMSDVIRGEGHISNTPVQVLIYKALDVEPPGFAHCSHLLTATRGKIAKRKGELSVLSFREQGILGEALFNYLALLGWTPKGEGREFLTREEVIREFNIYEVHRAAAVFDEEKLRWVNGVYLRRKSRVEFAELCLPFVVAAGLATETTIRARWSWFVDLVAQVQERVHTLGEVPPYVDIFFMDEIAYDEKAVNKLLTAEARAFIQQVAGALRATEWTAPAIEDMVRVLLGTIEIQAKQALLALRVAVTGRTVSPPLFETMSLLGRERTLARLACW
ncbi:MAG: glutamate--tRNA ligase [Chloroflexota bacterium]|nr:glutamate--tRNA ligase [Chloroflexota bacterium]